MARLEDQAAQLTSAGAQRWGDSPGDELGPDFLARPSVQVAPELLGRVLVHDGPAGLVAVRLTEVEAYAGPGDPGSHARNGRTPRTGVMFGPAGHLYVYFTYGMHWCCNAVCGDEGVGVGVLLRALAPLTGLDAMRVARIKAHRDRDLCSGPARLTQAMGITGAHDGIDLVRGPEGFRIVDDGTPPPAEAVASGRVGVSHAADQPWRWYVAGDPNVSHR